MAKYNQKSGDISIIDTGVPFLEVKTEYIIQFFKGSDLVAQSIFNSTGHSDTRVLDSINYLISLIPIEEEQKKLYEEIDEIEKEINATDLDEVEKAQKIKRHYIRIGHGRCMLWADSFLGMYKRNKIGMVSKDVQPIPEEEFMRFMEGKPDAHKCE